MNKKALFISTTDEWETPKHIFEQYDNVYHFETDLCAIPENAKCKHYYTPEMDGLKQIWQGPCWCNPPYGRKIGQWVQKAAESSATVVMLLPARTDTKWFHDYCLPFGKITFLKGRLTFGTAKNPAPFPSMIVVFEGERKMTRYEKLVQGLTIEKMAETLYNGESECCITMCKLKSGDKYTCPISAPTKEDCIKCAIEYLMMEVSEK